MLMKTVLALFLALGVVQCQTPPGFEPSTGEKLGVKFAKNVEARNGNKLNKTGKILGIILLTYLWPHGRGELY